MGKFWTVLFSILLLWGCQKEDLSNSDGSGQTLPDCTTEAASMCDLVKGINTFGTDIFVRLHREAPEENLFLSPLSISTALTMTLNGANGTTYDDMHQTMAYGSLDLPAINGSFDTLLTTLPLLDPDVQLTPANAIYYRNGFPVAPEFLETNMDYFDSQVQSADFSDQGTVDLINQWISDNTGGKIDELLEVIPGDAVMYLINAIYFKGNWQWPFNPDHTSVADFTTADQQVVPVDMMNFPDLIEAPAFANETAMGIDLPFGNSTFSMTLVLPAPEKTVDDVIEALDGGAWSDWTSSLSVQEVTIGLPRFSLRYNKELNDVLKEMGMDIAFDGQRSDFTGMGVEGLFISLVKHEAFIEVNEAGAEGGAATLVEISRESASLNQFVFNRPFVFFVREMNSNAIIFAGKYMKPE